MPTYLYKIQPVRPAMLSEGASEGEAQITNDHCEYWKTQMEEGALILAGRTLNSDYSSFFIAIFNARDDAQAEALMRAFKFPLRS